LFNLSRSRYLPKEDKFEFNCADFNYRASDAQLSLF
jgi:hypothetical protein